MFCLQWSYFKTESHMVLSQIQYSSKCVIFMPLLFSLSYITSSRNEIRFDWSDLSSIKYLEQNHKWSVHIAHVLYIQSWCWGSSDGCNFLHFIPRSTVFCSLFSSTSPGPRSLSLIKSLFCYTFRMRTLMEEDRGT